MAASNKSVNLAEQCKEAKERLEAKIAAALLDFTAETGFAVNEVIASYHAPQGHTPLYVAKVKVTL